MDGDACLHLPINEFDGRDRRYASYTFWYRWLNTNETRVPISSNTLSFHGPSFWPLGSWLRFRHSLLFGCDFRLDQVGFHVGSDPLRMVYTGSYWVTIWKLSRSHYSFIQLHYGSYWVSLWKLWVTFSARIMAFSVRSVTFALIAWLVTFSCSITSL